MNPIEFGLRRPVTVMVAIVAMLGAGWFAVSRMKVDIFPSLDLPVIYVCQPYGGMDPRQMEGLIANYYEYHFLYIGGIHHVESRNVLGMSLMKLFFHPGTDMAQAMAETVGYVNRSRAFMPPGTVPPFIMRFDTGSVPVGYLVLNSDTLSVGEISDKALFRIRPMFAAIPGVSAPPPFGGNQRTVVLRVRPDRLRGYNLSGDDVVRALSSGNTISPSGNIRTTTTMPLVPTNAMVVKPSELGDILVKPGVFIRDVAPQIEDATDIPTGYALVNGRRAVYILVTKRAEASTLDVVNGVREKLPEMQRVLDSVTARPGDIKVNLEFDQSPYVTNSIQGVAFEGGLAAALVGLMVLLFLRDWRSVIVVVLNIPLALVGSVVALALCGQTINLMTLGGLALAVGILVDEATVEVENIHTQMDKTDSMPLAVRRGNAETAVPRLLAMLCILAVFIPSFFMKGSARALFVPLSLAVGFSMVTSYLLSSTFVPVLSVWLLRKHHHTGVGQAASLPATGQASSLSHKNSGWLSRVFSGFLRFTTRWRWAIVPSYVVGAAALIFFLGRTLGTEIFPQVDAGQFQFRLRAPTGTRIEQTEAITKEALEFIKKEVGSLIVFKGDVDDDNDELDAIKKETGEKNVAISLGYVGVVPPSYPINAVYLWMGGPEESVMRVALKPGVVRIEDVKRRLRRTLTAHLQEWLRKKWLAEGESPGKIDRIRELKVSFEPADIVNEVMSFGSPTPVEVVVSGSKMPENRAFAEKLYAQLAGISSLQDLQYGQALDYPTMAVQIDRAKAAITGVTIEEVARALVAATSSSRFTVPNYWLDPASGVGYQVQVEIPQALMRSPADLEVVPIKPNGDTPLLLRDVAEVNEGTMPGQIDRYSMRRVVSMTANIHGEDLGRVSDRLSDAIERTKRSMWVPTEPLDGKNRWMNVISKEIVDDPKKLSNPPAGIEVDARGQVTPMREIFHGLTIGLGVAIGVIFLLLIAYFQSITLAITAIAAIPAVLCGVVVALLITGTTLNLQSFMGAIMAVGVAVANAILLVTFAERARREGKTAADAGVEGARSRVRAILMTSLAMIAGMLPMALGLGEGGDQTAPLGRAVIGGLAASTLATLILLPSVFALIMSRSSTASVSLSPTDPGSRYYVPDAVKS